MLFGTSCVNQASISEKDYVLNRGGLTDTANSFFLRKLWSKVCREKSADTIVVGKKVNTPHEGQNLIIKRK
ncbi:hypothetical protein JCM16496A_22330 [Bacteroides rodentium JCM 16496]